MEHSQLATHKVVCHLGLDGLYDIIDGSSVIAKRKDCILTVGSSLLPC